MAPRSRPAAGFPRSAEMPQDLRALVFAGLLHVDRIPVGCQAAGNAGAHAKQTVRARTRRQADHHLFRDGSLLKALGSAVFRGARAHLLGGGAQSEFTQ